VKKLAVVLKVESDHLIVCVTSTLNKADFQSTVENTAEWYPLAPALAVGDREPLTVENTDNRASYVLLRRLFYYPDDTDNKVLVSDRFLSKESLALIEAAVLPGEIISGK